MIDGGGGHDRSLWNQLRGNFINDNSGDGVRVQNNSSGITIGDGNSIHDNRGHGVAIAASNRIEVKQNSIIRNAEHGIEIKNSETIHISRETIQDNRQNGIDIEHGKSVVIELSEIQGNDDYGVNIENSRPVTIMAHESSLKTTPLSVAGTQASRDPEVHSRVCQLTARTLSPKSTPSFG